MTCQQIRQQIIDGKDNKDIRLHVQTCKSCAGFQSFVSDLRRSVVHQTPPVPSARIIYLTRQLCRQELNKDQTTTRRSSIKTVPGGILMLLSAITLLTFAWLFVLLYDYQTTGQAGGQIWLLFSLIIQNLFSLIVSPVLFRKNIQTINI